MADPLSVVATAAAPAAVAGAGAFVLTSLGLEPGPLFWALIGATIGMTWAASASRPRATTLFVCVVLMCSLGGSWISVKYTGGEQISRNLFSGGLAAVFHPLLNGLINAIPNIFNAAVTRFIGPRGE